MVSESTGIQDFRVSSQQNSFKLDVLKFGVDPINHETPMTIRHIALLTIVIGCLGTEIAFADSRTMDEFITYASRRIANAEETKIKAFAEAVDANGDGEISDEEFSKRTDVFQRIFLQSKVKARKSGHELPENWSKTYEDAQKRSKESGKPVVVMFSASWCGPCKAMIANVFPTDEAKQALKKFVPVYFDSEKQKELASKNSIRAYPTFVCFDPEGEEIARKVGGGNVEKFVAMLEGFNKEAK